MLVHLLIFVAFLCFHLAFILLIPTMLLSCWFVATNRSSLNNFFPVHSCSHITMIFDICWFRFISSCIYVTWTQNCIPVNLYSLCHYCHCLLQQTFSRAFQIMKLAGKHYEFILILIFIKKPKLSKCWSRSLLLFSGNVQTFTVCHSVQFSDINRHISWL